jgi:hypothetical protein
MWSELGGMVVGVGAVVGTSYMASLAKPTAPSAPPLTTDAETIEAYNKLFDVTAEQHKDSTLFLSPRFITTEEAKFKPWSALISMIVELNKGLELQVALTVGSNSTYGVLDMSSYLTLGISGEVSSKKLVSNFRERCGGCTPPVRLVSAWRALASERW